jgi:diguanylate cyclase (GGDEF)-like protein
MKTYESALEKAQSNEERRKILRQMRNLRKKFFQLVRPRVDQARFEARYDSRYPWLLHDRYFKEYFIIKGKEHTKGSFAFIDIDYLKKVNDKFGHSTGDRVLEAFAMKLRTHIEKLGGEVGRHGGEELVVYAPVDIKTLINALREADKDIKEHIRRISTPLPEASTMSVGIVPVKGSEIRRRGMEYYAEVCEEADRLLYYSKRRRNALTYREKGRLKTLVIRRRSRYVNLMHRLPGLG